LTVLDYKLDQATLMTLADLTSHVGGTPLLALRRVTLGLSPRVQVLAKAEWFNPGGSVKDRPALNIIRAGLSRGELVPGKRLLDSTSGNMGISYATFGAALGIPVTLTVPENVSPERLTILQALGVEVILTDPMDGSDGAIRAARDLAAQHPEKFWYANQYDNPANWQAHYQSTGPEIFDQIGQRVTHFVAGLGTSGTLLGAGKYLREANPSVQIVQFQPDDGFHGLEGLKHMPSAMQPGIFDPSFADRTLEVETEEAYAMTRKLAREEGLFVGISAGAAAVAALRVAAELDEGLVVTVFPDSGYKYLSDKELWSHP
jgi:cysteine synthase B